MVDESRVGGLQTFSIKDQIVNTGVGKSRFTVVLCCSFELIKLL